MPSQKGKRAKGVQMTEQQPKILQITQYIVQMPPTQDIVQIPATQDIVQIPATQDILQMAAHMLGNSAAQTSPGRKPILED